MSDFVPGTLQLIHAPPSRQTLLALIRWLDTACWQNEVTSLPVQTLARCMVAAGALVFAPEHPTLQAAKAFLLQPTPDTYAHYFEQATASYPFGSGEGCYAVPELEAEGCGPGSGCSSGAGSLESIALTAGVEAVLQAIQKEVTPWLMAQ